MYSIGALLLILITNLIGQSNANCLARCVCDDIKSSVKCSNSGFHVVPIMLNPWLKELNIANNHIKKMTPLNSVYNDLELLDLSNNEIDFLEDNIFKGLSKIKVCILILRTKFFFYLYFRLNYLLFD